MTAHAHCGDSCRWLYRQTIVESDGHVVRSQWLNAQTIELWLLAINVQGRRPKRLLLERIHSFAPSGRKDTLYDSMTPWYPTAEQLGTPDGTTLADMASANQTNEDRP